MSVTKTELDEIRAGLIQATGITFDCEMIAMGGYIAHPSRAQVSGMEIAWYINRKISINQDLVNDPEIKKDHLIAIMGHEIGHEIFAPRSGNPNAWAVFEAMIMGKVLMEDFSLNQRIVDWNMVHGLCNALDDQIVNISLAHSPIIQNKWGSAVADGFSSDLFPFYGWMADQGKESLIHSMIMLIGFDRIDGGRRQWKYSMDAAVREQCSKVVDHIFNLMGKSDDINWWDNYREAARGLVATNSDIVQLSRKLKSVATPSGTVGGKGP